MSFIGMWRTVQGYQACTALPVFPGRRYEKREGGWDLSHGSLEPVTGIGPA